MATITLKVTEADKAFMKAMAKFEGVSLSELIRTKTLEALEDEYDLAVLRQAMEEDDGVRISHEDLMAEFGL
ncbi:DUF6290 family protein [Streptococcus suis]|nr:DUF6290 family protein [Streptococcus suis]